MNAARPDISIEPYHGTVNVRFSDALIASSRDALVLRETGHDPVYYIPFEDIYFEFLRPSPTRTRCPLKGEARYWSVGAVGEAAEDAMWTYETPYEAARPITGHAAFDPAKVTIELTPRSSSRELPEV